MHLCGFPFLKTASPFLALVAFTMPVCIPDIGNIIWLSSCARLSAIRFGPSVTVPGMFTGVSQKHRQAAETYFDEHLSHNDYYTQGQTQHGQWIGNGAERLGLTPGNIVTRDEFLKLCDNQHPLTGEQLTPQHFKDRRIYFDFVCSPPKSVSILAVTMNDRRIIEAHKEASMIALRELESFAATRIRKGGVEDKDRMTGNLVGAAFLHTTSRALDPQLHTHFVLFNCTWDSKERRWKALQTSGMFGAVNYATEVYRNELAKRLNRMGYSIWRTGTAFEIDGVDPDLIERFSKRSQQQDIAVKRREQELGRKLTKKEVAHVVHQTRAKKLRGISDEQVRRQQLGEIGFFEKRALRKVVAAANGRAVPPTETVTESIALSHGLDHVFERQSVVPQHRIFQAALVKGCGQLDLEQLKKELHGNTNLVRVGSEFSTREILTKELFLINSVNAGMDAVKPFAEHYEPPARLGDDQRKALSHVLTSTDQFTGFRGLAGSGKSATLVELATALCRRGYDSIFCAPTAAAADTLRKEVSYLAKTMTLQKLLADPQIHSELSRGMVIVLDEAGAVGLDDMAKLFELARLRQCRVVMSGDTGQHSSVPRGDALRILEQYSAYRFSELTTIRRQKPEAFREVVELAAAKQTDKAFAKLVELGAVSELPADDNGGRAPALYQRAADAYVSATKHGKSALLVSPTWAEIDAVTEKVRHTLKAEGVISQDEHTLCVFDSLSWTEAQRKNVRQYEPGQRLRFVRKTKKFDRGETVEITGIMENGLRVRRADRTEVDFIPASAATCFDVGEARELKVAAGDWLLLQANHGKEFINGQRVQVREIQNGRVTLADGRTLPANFNTFTHGYAVTSHSSQGKTVDEVLLVASSRSFPAVNREQFYVSISRGRERIHVFTDDTELLARRVTDSQERKAAIELQALRDDLAKLGFNRKEQTDTEARKPALTTRQDFRATRPVRAMRSTRFSRLPAVQRLAQIVEEVHRWFGKVLAQGIHKEAVVKKIESMQTVEQAEKIAQTETVKPTENIGPPESVRSGRFAKPRITAEELRQRLAERRNLRRGITSSGDTGHSHSRGIGV
jgi:conjugative relaxase-like TrwC/TraI family protein